MCLVFLYEIIGLVALLTVQKTFVPQSMGLLLLVCYYSYLKNSWMSEMKIIKLPHIKALNGQLEKQRDISVDYKNVLCVVSLAKRCKLTKLQ